MREEFPDQHVLAIGDISAEHGGQITEHHSHQSGRDVDLGLFYYEKPRNYPDDFVRATADNLDCEATFALLAGFAATAREDGGAQMIFLDFDVQGLIYEWAKDHGVSEERLARMFQFPHGRDSGAGLVRHYPGPRRTTSNVRLQVPGRRHQLSLSSRSLLIARGTPSRQRRPSRCPSASAGRSCLRSETPCSAARSSNLGCTIAP